MRKNKLVLCLGCIIPWMLAGCGSIHTGNEDAANKGLTPHPKQILVDVFDTAGAEWLVGRQTDELNSFKKDLQLKFQDYLVERLQKIGAAKKLWPAVNSLPEEGWLIKGEFLVVYQGSRFLRTMVGGSAGETTFRTRVYVYDLSVSRTEYVLSFDTGVPNERGIGQGSGRTPTVPIGNVVGAGVNMGAGLCLDMTRTARMIRDVLIKYSGAPEVEPVAR